LQAGGTRLTHEDDRLWARRFTYQNQRLLYWPLLASGDFDLLKPFFAYYSDVLPMRKAITKAWFGHDGAYYRENIEPTGAERDCGQDGRPPKGAPGEAAKYYHDYYFTSGLETVAMMSDYVNYSGDMAFRDQVLVPFAREILLFFDLHYRRGTDRRLRLDPAQVVETWWLAVNPSPDIAGLRFCLDELLAMKAGTAEDQARWRKFRAEIPDVPLQAIEGRQAIAPAEKWAQRHNAENGELYPVFPFRCFGVGLGSGDLVDWTMHIPQMPYKTPCYIFRNLSGKAFEELMGEAGADIAVPRVGRGCAFGDFDNDGDVDILLAAVGEPPVLFRNDVSGDGRWLKVRLIGTKSNRSAIGARVLARYGDRIQAQERMAQSSFLCSNDPRLHFGLGAVEKADLEVWWPSGRRDRFEGVAAGQLVTIREGEGIVAKDKMAPTSASRPAL
jgi:hypothetical protein